MSSTSAALATSAFTALTSHLKQWFYQPDIEALEITLAVAASHYIPGDPTWIFVIGPPATGKTSVNIQALRLLPSAYLMGDLTPATFLSAKRRGNAEPSLLNRLGSPLLLMKDFTTLLSKRPDDKAMIISQLREIYDGVFCKDTGESGRLYWTGKATVIAACTPAIEREWMLQRDLGERFMTVRWERENGPISAKRTVTQRMKESEINARTAQLGSELLSHLPKTRADLDDKTIDRIAYLSEIVARGRNRVIRSAHTHDVIEVCTPEGPNRIAKSLVSVIVNYASIFNREPVAEDMRLAVRLAMNSIPQVKYKILSNIPHNVAIDSCHLIEAAKLPESTLNYHLEELEAQGLLKRIFSGNVVSHEFSQELRDLWRFAFPSTT